MQIQDYFRATQSRYPSRKYQPFGNIMDVNEVVVAAEVISSEDNECFECEEYQRNEMGKCTALAVLLTPENFVEGDPIKIRNTERLSLLSAGDNINGIASLR